MWNGIKTYFCSIWERKNLFWNRIYCYWNVFCKISVATFKDCVCFYRCSRICWSNTYSYNKIRNVIYTTDAIESLNAVYRKWNRQRSVFPSDTVLFKALYLSTFEATKKWTMTIQNWGQVYGELSIMYPDRLPE